ncbi:Hemolysin transporter protein ShlB precursor [Marinomonas spartinae]|uniref:Hemolysin transporter protein ShlB n=1 Tax=Marinomonas spartinae TaxID=1792290 RepID=A0A1A8T748_9GAMM|nr:ShlB/FhaC/HecB family hemolysin secretion/activation protein [Marinomonas spartinae]SBS27169.1 Hemolysin transporter protein ShlB precursor [Marinomonas spartinae]
MDVYKLMDRCCESRRGCFTSLVLCCLGMLASGMVRGIELPASTNSTDWKLRDQQALKTLEQKSQSNSPPIQLPKAPSIGHLPKEHVCFLIKKVQVEGFYARWAMSKAHKLIGRCLGQKGIKSYIRLINQKLLHDGYVTSRATLPEQNIATGVLHIKVTKGVIEKIVFPEEYRFYWQNALPFQVGDVLNLRDIEQGLEQINRLQSQDVKFKIEPGSYEGASILVAKVVQSKPWTVNLSVDDSGSDTTGKYPLSAGVSVDNFLGVEDIFNYSASYARQGSFGESNSQSVSWDIPLGFNTISFSHSQFDYQQQAIGSVRNFILSGNGQNDSLRLNHVLFRNNVIKMGWFGAVKGRQRKSFIDDTEIKIQRHNLMELDLGSTYRQYIHAAVLDLTLGVHQGVTWFHSDGVDPRAASGSTQPDYRFYSLSASLTVPVMLAQKHLHYTSQFWWQYAATPLYSMDWFNNGGRYTVRGFSSSESLSAENGWRSRNELLLPVSLLGSSSAGYLGLDVGQVSGRGSDDISSKTLMGLSIGIKGQVGHLSYDAFISNPFLAHGPYATSNDFKVNGSLSMNF